MPLLRFTLFLIAVVLLAACVPSPTATPPRATAFPTLPPPPTEPPTPTLSVSALALPSATQSPVLAPTLTQTVIAPSPASPAVPPDAVSATPSISSGTFETVPPVLQVLPSELSSIVSSGQPLALRVLAADNAGIARVELYDEKKLYSAAIAPIPPPRQFSTILMWKPFRAGPHHLQVIAFDRAGNASAPAEFTFDVVIDNRGPMVQFTNYVGAVNVATGAPLLLQGVATDEAAVTRVDLYVDDSFYTFVAPGDKNGQTPFAFPLMWVPPTTGTHKLYLRAHDNEDQTGDSPVLLVNAISAQPPALVATYERDEALVNGNLLVHALALSPGGITRVELWADDQPAGVINSAAPDGQTAMETTLVWEASNIVGDHNLLVRVYDRAGLATSSPPQVIHVRPAGTRLATPTIAPARPSATAMAPTETATPQVIVPAPPSISVSTVQDPTAALLDGPLHIRLSAHGADELDHVELWAVYQGETTPILVFSDTVKGATDRTLTVDWMPPEAGIVLLYAHVADQIGQVGDSPVMPVYLVSSPAPTETPALPSLAGRWAGSLPAANLQVSFIQWGRAIRGTVVETSSNGNPIAGTIITGDAARDRLTFTAEWSTRPGWLDVDCTVATESAQMTCSYQDETGNRGTLNLMPAP